MSSAQSGSYGKVLSWIQRVIEDQRRRVVESVSSSGPGGTVQFSPEEHLARIDDQLLTVLTEIADVKRSLSETKLHVGDADDQWRARQMDHVAALEAEMVLLKHEQSSAVFAKNARDERSYAERRKPNT